MTIKKRLNRSLALVLSLVLASMPLAAQSRKDGQATPKATTREAATFDNLLATNDYKFYGEIKNVGQLIRSPNVADVIDPVMKLTSPPREFKSLVKFANAHAELLQTSRVFFAAWPAKSKIPQTLWAIEFSSADEAQKFEPQLREFLPTILPTPEPSPTPAGTTAPGLPMAATLDVDPALAPADSRPVTHGDGKAKGTDSSPAKVTVSGSSTAKVVGPSPAVATQAAATKPAPLPFIIKQLGNLVLISDTPFNVNNLRPENSEALFDNPNFRQAHDRFGAEQIFLFFNIGLDERQRMAPTDVELSEQSGKLPTVVVEEPAVSEKDAQATADPVEVTNTPEEQAAIVESAPTASVDSGSSQQQAVLVAGNSTTEVSTASQGDFDLGMGMVFGTLFGGKPKLPEAVGVAIAFEGDSYAARVLLVGGPDGKAAPVPFISQWVSGPALTLESPSILPADTELFVAASLDTPGIYEGLVKTMNDQVATFERTSRQPRATTQPVGPFAALEKKVGLTIKEDLLPVLGHEIALSVPVNAFTGNAAAAATAATGEGKDQAAAKKAPRSPVILVSLKDKEAAHILVPKIIEGLGFKGAGMLAQKEQRDDTEIVSYAGVFAYAFVGNFLVLSPDAATTRHVVDSYLKHETLASDSQFRSSTRWQPRQLLGQVYVSPALMETYRTYANNPTALVSDKVREFLARLSPVSEPVTYSLSSDGLGPLHELHVPKNLILMMVAGISEEANQPPLIRNEQTTRVALMMIANSEKTYHQNQGKGQYASLEQLFDQQMLSKELLREHGYRFELNVSGDKFTATAVPNEYNKTGRLSYFVDETGVVRGGDHGGSPATVADSAVQ